MFSTLPAQLTIGNQEIPLRIRRNRRAKRMYLRYLPTDHSFTLTLPYRARLEEGAQFITAKSDWIAETLQQMPQRRRLRTGMRLPLLGQEIEIVYRPSLQVPFALKDGQLEIGPGEAPMPKRIEAALKKIARHELSELAELKAAQLDKSINRITLRDTHSRWGSCSSDRNLMFSWRLIFAPYEVLDYVVSHEVAHLNHMDHSARFWRCVESVCPHYLVWKDWLRFHGKELYRFTTE